MKNKEFWLASTGHMTTDFYLNFLPVLVPVMAARLDLTFAEAGLIFTATQIAANFIQPVFGHVYDRRPRSSWLVLSLAGSGVFMCTAGLLDNYWALMVFAVLSGVGNGMYHPVGSALAYRVEESRRGFFMSIFSTAGAFGYAVSPAVAASLIERYSPGALLYLLIPVPVLILFMRGIQIDAPDENNTEHPAGNGTLAGLFSGVMVLLVVVMSLRAWANLAYTSYMPFLLQHQGFSYTASANLLTLFGIIGAAGSLLLGKLAERVNRNTLIMICLTAAALFSCVFLTSSGWPALVFLMMVGLFNAACLPLLVVMSQDLLPNNIGLASGLAMGFAWGVGGLGIYLNGLIADTMGLVPSFWLSTLVMAAAAVVFGIMIMREKGGVQHERV